MNFEDSLMLYQFEKDLYLLRELTTITEVSEATA